MAKFVYIYSGGKMPETPEEGQQVMAAWMALDGRPRRRDHRPGQPVRRVDVGHARAAPAAPATAGGYTIINADSLDDATKKADGCPILAAGGTVERLRSGRHVMRPLPRFWRAGSHRSGAIAAPKRRLSAQV